MNICFDKDKNNAVKYQNENFLMGFTITGIKNPDLCDYLYQ